MNIHGRQTRVPYPVSVAGMGSAGWDYKLGRLGLSSSKTLVPRAIVNGSKYIEYPMYHPVMYRGFSRFQGVSGLRSPCISVSHIGIVVVDAFL